MQQQRNQQTPSSGGDNSRVASNIPDNQKLEQKYGVDMSIYCRIEDLTHLVGPLTEDSVLRCLQARFYTQLYDCKIGPVVVALNSYQYQHSTTALVGQAKASPLFKTIIKDAVTQQADTGQSQTIILSGETGSGKTRCTMQILQELYERIGEGTESETFKHLSNSLTVLHSLCRAATILNPESSRVSMFVENFICDSSIYRTKIHTYLLDRDRVCRVQRYDKNYNIFYQMLAGLSAEEKAKLHLTGYSLHNLRFLGRGSTFHREKEDQKAFAAWKSSLLVLGIPFSDVMRIFSAVLLLGNIEFVEGTGLELDLIGNNEVKSVAALLGVSGVALYRGFTTKTRNVRGQVCKSLADVVTANTTRDALAKALYFRTVSAILKRANNLRRSAPGQGNSADSQLHQDTSSFESPLKRQSSMTCSVSSSKSPHTGVFSVLDMFGFVTAEVNYFEEFCMNLCAETIQHFYNTHIFKNTLQALRDEAIQVDTDTNYFDNEPILQLLSSRRNGLLNILDMECTQPRTSPESYVSKVKVHHRTNNYFFEPLPKADCVFGIRHFAGRVVYDASNFLTSNRDVLPDDILCIFSKQNCNFGFASHLFSHECKSSTEGSGGPKGVKYRILPGCTYPQVSGQESKGTLSRDFQLKLEKLLKTLVHAKPHLIQCLKSNDGGEMDLFDKEVVLRQLRSLQTLQTLQLMAGGVPHRMRYKAFNSRYGLFLCKNNHRLRGSQQDHNVYTSGSQQDRCKEILDCIVRAMDESNIPYVSTQWNLGNKHIFFSESTRQHFEAMREEKLNKAATLIQSVWRGYRQRAKHLQNKKKSKSKQKEGTKKDFKLLNQASKYYSINLESAPSVPISRNYNVTENVRISYPQYRILKEDFPSEGNGDQVLYRGEEVHVIGPSPKRGHLLVEKRKIQLHVPYSLLDIKVVSHKKSYYNETRHLQKKGMS